MFMPIADPSISLEENTAIAKQQNAALMTFPEVEYVVAKIARADTSTDPAPLNMTETIVHLKPKDRVAPGHDAADAARRHERRSATARRVEHLDDADRQSHRHADDRHAIGSRGQDLRRGPRHARVAGARGGGRHQDGSRCRQRVSRAVDQRTVPEHLRRSRRGRAVRPRRRRRPARSSRPRLARRVVATTIEGRQRFPVRVRYGQGFRADPQAVGSVLVATPGGAQIPLSQVARIEAARGPAMLSSENGLLLATVLLNVQGRDVGGFVAEAREAVARTVRLPAGYYVAGAEDGKTRNTRRQRLQVVLPVGAAGDLRPAVLHLHSAGRGGPRAARRTVRADGRPLSSLAARLQLLGGRVGRLHRAVRHRGTDRCRHGDLSRGSRRAEAEGARRRDDARRPARRGDRRRAAPAAAESHDGVHGDRGAAPNHVEPADGRRRDEAARHARTGRHGVVAAARAHRHARDLLLDPAAPAGLE